MAGPAEIRKSPAADSALNKLSHLLDGSAHLVAIDKIERTLRATQQFRAELFLTAPHLDVLSTPS